MTPIDDDYVLRASCAGASVANLRLYGHHAGKRGGADIDVVAFKSARSRDLGETAGERIVR